MKGCSMCAPIQLTRIHNPVDDDGMRALGDRVRARGAVLAGHARSSHR